MSNRKIQKLNEILLKNSTYKHIGYYANKIGVSERSIRNYLHASESEYKRFGLDLKIEYGHGILLDGKNSDKKEFLSYLMGKNNDLISRRRTMYEMLLMQSETVTIKKLSIQFYVSPSSIVNDLKMLEKSFNKFDLKLEKGRKGTYIAGSEQKIRKAQQDYLWKQNNGVRQNAKGTTDNQLLFILKKFYNNEIIDLIKKCVSVISDGLRIVLDRNRRESLMIWLAILIDRLCKHEVIKKAPLRPLITEMHNLMVYPITLQVKNLIENEVNVQINELDERWLNARISGIYREDTNTFTKSTNTIIKYAKKMIQNVSDILEVDLVADQDLLKSLINHLIPMFVRISNNFDINNPFLSQIKNQYWALFSVMKFVFSMNSEKLKISDDEIGFLLLHFQLALERKKVSSRIVIYTDEGSLLIRLIESGVKEIVNPYDVVETICDFEEIERLCCDKSVDFIISTREIMTSFIPVCYISPILTKEDEERIRVFYKRLSDGMRTSKYDSFTNIINKRSLLNYKVRDCDKTNILKYACSILEEEGYVTNGFFKSVLNRELTESTYLGKGIAIPHGSTEYVKNNQIFVVTLNQGVINWPEPVDVIVIFALNTVDFKETRLVLKSFYEILNDSKTLDAIKESKTFNDLVNFSENLK